MKNLTEFEYSTLWEILFELFEYEKEEIITISKENIINFLKGNKNIQTEDFYMFLANLDLFNLFEQENAFETKNFIFNVEEIVDDFNLSIKNNNINLIEKLKTIFWIKKDKVDNISYDNFNIVKIRVINKKDNKEFFIEFNFVSNLLNETPRLYNINILDIK